MPPLDPSVHYGYSDDDKPEFELYEFETRVLPEKVHQLRSKLHQKAKAEPKFRFYALYDRVYRKDVLRAAWHLVAKANKAAGIDGVTAESIWSQENGVTDLIDQLHEELRAKTYRPSPVKRVYIDKADGGRRPLGIPTLRDRVVQMAVLLLLEPIYEADFADCSHGFRPQRSAHDALAEIRQHLKSGKRAVYDADLKGYFDSIPHDKLMATLRVRVVDRNVLKLIERWLKAPIIECDKNGKPKGPPRKNSSGTPQGGVISPLLANVYLHWLDKRFHDSDGPYNWANARLVRYADDFVILARYQGWQISLWLENLIERRLGLELNRAKSQIAELKDGEGSFDFLGYSFRYDRDLYRTPGKYYLNVVPSKKALSRAREVIRGKTGPKNCFKPAVDVIEDLNRYLVGWSSYFSFGYPRQACKGLNYHIYRRLVHHLNRRSQRKYKRPSGLSDYDYLVELGMKWLR